MEDTALPSNAGVTVECTDPSNLYAGFEHLLLQHLPLRNLHWKTRNRPVRSIDSLNVSLTRTDSAPSNTLPGTRRHQIPGLRQTPYLKLYLLRCDDNEAYKETSRKQVRQWIKAHSPTSDTGSAQKRENHDAFEWLIVHVVLPGTPAATQPVKSKHQALGTTDSTDSLGSKSKWPGKGSRTIYEKLRADFSSSSKAEPDRVAQVRLRTDDVSQRPLSTTLSAAEIDDQWLELADRLKLSILKSFDTRVAQYEDDIRERDSQRNLPGWNFCTFFMLKEGLAKGFENVGLLEDALASYDELAMELDHVVRDQTAEDDGDQAGPIVSFSKNLKDMIRVALAEIGDDPDESHQTPEQEPVDDHFLCLDTDQMPFSLHHKNYRELILANEISTLDFHIYIFSRQLEILLRQAISPPPKQPPSFQTPKAALSNARHDDLLVLAAICERAIDFINLTARRMRRGLYNAWGGQEGLGPSDLAVQKIVIDNIVWSWTYRATAQILSVTQSSYLIIPSAVENVTSSAADNRTIPSVPAPTDVDPIRELGQMREVDNRRRSEDLLSPDSYSESNGSASLRHSLSTGPAGYVSQPPPGGEPLATWRGELFLIAHTIVGNMKSADKAFDEELRGSTSRHEEEKSQMHKQILHVRTAGLGLQRLRKARTSSRHFNAMYEFLTLQACRHFVAARKPQSAGRALLDLVVQKYKAEEFEAAAHYFEAQVSHTQENAWMGVLSAQSGIYARCLKRLGRRAEYVRFMLKVLRVSTKNSQRAAGRTPEQDQDQLRELLAVSETLESSISVPLTDFISIENVDHYIHHFREKDGFYVACSFRLLIVGRITVSSGATMVLSAVDESRPSFITLRASESITISHDSTAVVFESNVSTSGRYTVDRIDFSTRNISFVFSTHEHALGEESEAGAKGPAIREPLLVYPCNESLTLKSMAAVETHLQQHRALLIQVEAGHNVLEDCIIRLRAATAGLRLRLHEAHLDDRSGKAHVQLTTVKGEQALRLLDVDMGGRSGIVLPYSLEEADVAVTAKVEVTYKTSEGSFAYFTSLRVNTILPVSVNAQDTFKQSTLYTRVTLLSATLVPLQVKKCSLEGNEMYDVDGGFDFSQALDIFPRQPASLLYRFTRRHHDREQRAMARPLTLNIEAQCLDEIILGSLENTFLADMTGLAVSKVSKLLCAHLVDTVRTNWTEEDLEVACLTREFEKWAFDEMGWQALLSGLSAAMGREARSWLEQWHATNHPIQLRSSLAPVRRIAIPVDVPRPTVVVTARLVPKVAWARSGVAVSEAVLAELIMCCTRSWQAADDAESGEGGEEDLEDLDVSFEVIAPAEQWLIGGQKRGTFRSEHTGHEQEQEQEQEQEHAFQVILLAQRPGHVLLPSIEVKCVARGGRGRGKAMGTGTGTGTGKGGRQVACEVDYYEHARSILVVPSLSSTTSALDGAGGRVSVLVDGESRRGREGGI